MTEQRLSFMEFESPWFFNPGTVRLPSPPDDLSTDEVRERLMTGQLAQPYILETSSQSGLLRRLPPLISTPKRRNACRREA